MLETDMKEKLSGVVHIKGTSVAIVRATVNFMYTGEIDFGDEALWRALCPGCAQICPSVWDQVAQRFMSVPAWDQTQLWKPFGVAFNLLWV